MTVYLVRAYIGRQSIIGLCSTPELAQRAANEHAAQKGLTLDWVTVIPDQQEPSMRFAGQSAKTVWYSIHDYEVDALVKEITS